MAQEVVGLSLEDLIKKLTDLPLYSEQDVLSIYLQTHGQNLAQRKQVRVFLEQMWRSPELQRLESAHRDWAKKIKIIAKQADAFLNDKENSALNGVAFFAWGHDPQVVTYASSLPFPNVYYVLPFPAVGPLVSLRDDYEPLCLCQFNQEEARIVEMTAGMMIEQSELGQEVYPHHKQGGWAQARFQRKHIEEADHFFREIAHQLEQRAVKNPKLKFALVGQRKELPLLVRFLPDQVERRLIAQEIAEMTLKNGHLARKGLEILRAYNKKREQDKTAELSLGRIAQGFGSVKSEKVYRAINQGQVETLLLRKGLDRSGSVCLECHTILEEYKQACPYCGQHVAVAPLDEILVYETLRHHGKVQWLSPTRAEQAPAYGVLYRERARIDYRGN